MIGASVETKRGNAGRFGIARDRGRWSCVLFDNSEAPEQTDRSNYVHERSAARVSDSAKKAARMREHSRGKANLRERFTHAGS